MKSRHPLTLEQEFDKLFKHCDSYIEDRLKTAGVEFFVQRLQEQDVAISDLRREVRSLRQRLDKVGKAFLQEG